MLYRITTRIKEPIPSLTRPHSIASLHLLSFQCRTLTRRSFHQFIPRAMPSKDKYTDPELREQVKEELKEGDKGGAPGQWSARKAQMIASEYKKRGGDYTTDKETGQDESQKNLQKWGEEDWQTKEGNGEARQEDGSRKRYLPKKAWEQMNEKEQEETDEKKQEASKKGQQHVENTQKAKNSRKKVNEDETKESDKKKQSQANGTKKGKSTSDNKSVQANAKMDDGEQGGDEEYLEEDDEEEYEEEGSEGDKDGMGVENTSGGDNEPKQIAGKKRGRKAKSESGNKSQKANSGKGKNNGTVGSKHDSADEPAQQGSAERLPKEGDRVSWKALPGWVHGELVEVVKSKKNVEGKEVKGSEKDPRYVLKADSGKICVHKPQACYYD